MNIQTTLILIGAACVSVFSGCTLTEAVPASDLEQTERGVFSASGRYLVVGVRPEGRSDAGGWLVEISQDPLGGYKTTNLVSAHLEGTADGSFNGAPAGAPCFFSGMAVRGEVVYAACVADDLRSSLLQMDLTTRRVRAGYFDSCNYEPSSQPCTPTLHYPNGMAIDSAGRIYVSDTIAHISEVAGELLGETVGSHTLTQINIDAAASQGTKLAFHHRAWFSNDLFSDVIAPNGVQIEGDILYYVGGPNINKVKILPNGNAGEARVHYEGPSLLATLDDFAIKDGQIVATRVITPALVAISASPFTGKGKEQRIYDMPLEAVPSSVAYQPESPSIGRIFPKDSLVITSYFGGGLYVLSKKR